MSFELPGVALHAWVDESVHVDAGLYVLAAAVASTEVCDAHRDALRPLARPARRRTHWKFEEDKDKRRLIEALSGLELRHVVAVASPIDHKRQERARRKCLERLMPRLAGVGVTQVWFESRSEGQDKKDRAMLAALRSCGLIDISVRADFARPLDEPMLWIPDAVAGAVSAAWKGRNGLYKAMLGLVEEIDVAL